MGSQCSCLREASQDENQLKLGRESPVSADDAKFSNETKIPGKSKFSFQSHMIEIVTLQSVIRGYMERKRAKAIYYKFGTDNKTRSSTVPLSRDSSTKSTNSGETTPSLRIKSNSLKVM